MDHDILDNENFKKWFGASRMLDDDGQPLVLYHGTTSEFYTFDLNKGNNESFAGLGFYFSSSPDDAQYNYASLNGPDFSSKRQKFIEDIESYADIIDKDDYDEDEINESVNNFKEFINELVDSHYNYVEKVQQIQNFISDNALLLINDSKLLEEMFYTLVQQKNDGVVHSVYLKIEKPFYLEKQEWEKEFILGDEIHEIFSQFIQENENSQSIISHLLENLQYYAQCETESQLSIDKSSFFEIIEVDLDDLNDMDEDEFNDSHSYTKVLVQKLSEYWDEHIGEDEYLMGSFEDNDIVTKFKDFLKNRYGHHFSGRDYESIDSLEHYDDIVNAEKLFNDVQNNLSFLYDYSNEGISSSGVFFDFIYSLGFDGIIMNANRFQNMQYVEDTQHYIVREPNQIKLADGLNTQFSKENDDIRFKKVMVKPSLSISAEEAFSTIENFHLAFPNLSYTRIFQTQKDIEKYTKTKDKVAGIYTTENNKPFVGVVLENIHSKQQLENVLLHEHLGHASLREILDSEYEKTMLNIFKYMERKNIITYNSEWNKKDKIEIAEEFFANSMENKNEHTSTLISKVKIAIGKIIRSVFPNMPFMSSDLVSLQEKSHNFSKKEKLKK